MGTSLSSSLLLLSTGIPGFTAPVSSRSVGGSFLTFAIALGDWTVGCHSEKARTSSGLKRLFGGSSLESDRLGVFCLVGRNCCGAAGAPYTVIGGGAILQQSPAFFHRILVEEGN